jgi:hypothetical protein
MRSDVAQVSTGISHRIVAEPDIERSAFDSTFCAFTAGHEGRGLAIFAKKWRALVDSNHRPTA